MSYLSNYGGKRAFGGFGYGSLGSAFPIGPTSDSLRSLQRELARLGYLQGDNGPFGADGYWGPRTALALRQAATYLRWTDAPYTPTNADSLRSGSVEVPDDLIARIRAASPDPNASRAGSDQPASIVDPVDPAPPTSPVPSTRLARAPWVVPVAVGGVTLLAVGALLLTRGKKPVTSNRRRRARRRR
jgi:peptidoglycan hydrolase-like protein with peptidoglycan-binding domain